MKVRIALLTAVAGAALIAPGVADAKAVRGTVVKRDRALKTVVVTVRGSLMTIHTGKRLRPGTVVRINGRSIRVLGHVRKAHVRGLVIRHARRTFDLSSGRSVIRIRSRVKHADGSALDVTVDVGQDGIDEVGSNETGDIDDAELQGTLTSTDGTSLLLTLADGTTKTILTGGIDVSALVGHQVEVEVSMAPDATGASVLTLLKIEDQEAGDNDGDNMCEPPATGGPGSGPTPHDGGGGNDDNQGNNNDNSSGTGCGNG